MINFATENPKQLLASVKKAIDDGHIVTWAYDSDGDFTHTANQWNKRAWLRPHISASSLSLSILGTVGNGLSRELYAIYHGRFLEMMLAHFDTSFSNSETTALAALEDIVRARA